MDAFDCTVKTFSFSFCVSFLLGRQLAGLPSLEHEAWKGQRESVGEPSISFQFEKGTEQTKTIPPVSHFSVNVAEILQ